jgi:hypothetical protein
MAVLAVIMLAVVGFMAAPAQATVNHYYKVQDLSVNQWTTWNVHHWVGHIYLRVRWETDTGPSPDIAHVDSIEGIHPISITNNTNYGFSLGTLNYVSVDGWSGQYQSPTGSDPWLDPGDTYYPLITNANWYPNPPTHWLPWADAPRVGLSAWTSPAVSDGGFDPVSTFNYVPNIPA